MDDGAAIQTGCGRAWSRFTSAQAVPNQALQPTPSSVRSSLAPASGHGLAAAFGCAGILLMQMSMRAIPKGWLQRRIDPARFRNLSARSYFTGRMQPTDELWRYDEPMPPHVLAGELGYALVRNGEPIGCHSDRNPLKN